MLDPSDFKGNVDLEKLEELLKSEDGSKVPFVLMTITNNTGEDSLYQGKNLKAVKALCKK
ncbi:MAG: hypothetical protein CM1200mP7_3630 [Chloroflexota bacterium]|nr:MAG: hypothetical protein CM1200mP7_3630 [Chloroflexota bacterium]